jgi:serine phosphatase RsbU (regulator of sigma subunit)
MQYKLNKGDIVAIMSDGFPELFNEDYEMFGYDTKCEALVLENIPAEHPEDDNRRI